MSTFRVVTAFLAFFFLTGFFYVGPPFKSTEALKSLPPDSTVMVGITHVTVGDDRKKNKVFWDNTFTVVESLPKHEGYLGHKIRKILLGKQGWTMTVWQDENSLNRFVRGSTHASAIGTGLPAVTEARFVRLSVKRSELPLSWEQAETLMDTQGRKLY